MKSINKNLISIIVPACNEELLITCFLKDVTGAIDKMGLNYELIVVENGSSDLTAEKTLEYIKKDKKVKLLQLKTAAYGLALIKGLKAASGKYCVIFNVDFWDIKFLMLTQVNLLGYDIISGSKLLPGSQDLRSVNRRFVTWMFNFFLKYLMGYKGTDTHGIKVLDRERTQPVLRKCYTTSGIFDSEFMLRSQRHGLNILELPVVVKEIRKARFSFQRILRTPFDILELSLVMMRSK